MPDEPQPTDPKGILHETLALVINAIVLFGLVFTSTLSAGALTGEGVNVKVTLIGAVLAASTQALRYIANVRKIPVT